jgi:hypothetical protein
MIWREVRSRARLSEPETTLSRVHLLQIGASFSCAKERTFADYLEDVFAIGIRDSP